MRMRYRNYNNSGNIIWLILLLFMMFGGFRFIFLLFGAGLLLLINFFPLIILGFFIYMVSKAIRNNSKIHSGIKDTSVDQRRFVTLLIHIICVMIRADGKVDQSEVQAVFNFFNQRLGYSQFRMLWVSDLLKNSLQKHYGLEQLCAEFTTKFNYESKLILLELLYAVATSDNEVHKSEIRVIKDVVELLEISKEDHDRIRSMFHVQASKKEGYHYTVLGVNANASKEEIKKAYKAAIKKHHPDKVHHLGDEFRKVAEDKLKKINESYEVLMK